MKLEENKPEILICECNSSEHQIVLNYDVDDNYVYCSIHLVKYRFFKRLIHGIKYIFGYTCRYGHFEEFILSDRHVDKLKTLTNSLEKKND